jgi:hypothetical protein
MIEDRSPIYPLVHSQSATAAGRPGGLAPRGWTRLLGVLLGCLLAACSGGQASPGRPSGGAAAPAAVPDVPPASFYQVPDPLPPGRPGALIRSVAIAGSPQVPGSGAWAMLYHSRDFDGRDVAVSGWWPSRWGGPVRRPAGGGLGARVEWSLGRGRGGPGARPDWRG